MLLMEEFIFGLIMVLLRIFIWLVGVQPALKEFLTQGKINRSVIFVLPLDGFFIDHAGDTSYTLAGNLLAGNISLNGNGAMTTTVLTINASVKLSNVDLTGPGSGTRTISIDGSDVCLSNFLTGVLTLSTSRSDLKMTNGEVTSACTINGDRYCFTNVKFIGGATVPTGQDNNGFINCQFGADAGGGALTLTIDAGANNTRVLGSMSDAAISDAGTGTVTLGNT